MVHGDRTNNGFEIILPLRLPGDIGDRNDLCNRANLSRGEDSMDTFRRNNEQARYGLVGDKNQGNLAQGTWLDDSVPDSLAPTKDFIEMAVYSLFFASIYWCTILVICLVKETMGAWLTGLTFFLLASSLLAAAGLCYRACGKWYEYGALEYWQPIKDLLRAGIKRKGFSSLGCGILIGLMTLVYGPFLVGTVAWVDELGQRQHRD